MKLLRTLVFASVWLVLSSCASVGRFSASEAATIDAEPGEGVMRVLKTTDCDDSLRLRGRSGRIGRAWLGDPLYARLKRRMLCTVNDPADPGVGIAAPQVGVSRRLVAVQRFDREGEPFEFYVNPRIVRYAGGTVRSPEGCLSIPGRIDTAVRRERVVLRYRDGQSGKRRRESVSGFTAVVFQHEIDHLNGILFIDRTPDRAAGNRRHKSSKP
ncbi:peptide deformylase [Alistipes ihumii]|uniref:peptide deformylase n=1 Tax=Alistipes ihumii TaxID=1470347 RepID=UPI0024951E6E|nr:peptide deformylase [Alistipes ihumii]